MNFVAEKTGKPAMPTVDVKRVEEERSAGEENPEVGGRKVKMQDLESVSRSEGIRAHPLKFPKHKAASDSSQCGEGAVSQLTVKGIAGSRLKANDERIDSVMDGKHGFKLNHNSDALSACTLARGTVLKRHFEEPEETDVSALLTLDKASENGVSVMSGGFSFDLNVEDVPTSMNRNLLFPYPNFDQSNPKATTISECGSSTQTNEEKDPRRIWNAMKRNGYLSSSYGGIPVAKQCGRKSKDKELKKKLELAKKEEVDRFAKIAAPSGLLNELNPGIINHVRNRKQVHAIIEALVRSEISGNSDARSQQPSNRKGRKNATNSRKEFGCNETGDQRFYYPYGNLDPSVSRRKHNVGCPVTVDKSPFSVSWEEQECTDSVYQRGLDNKRFRLNPHSVCQDDALALSLSSANGQASEVAFSASDEDSILLSSIDSLSVKAASISSHWLELLHQDIKARLTALRRSKKRVQAVISTELPILLAKEFSSNPGDNNLYFAKETTAKSDNKITDIHGLKWTSLFEQMEKALVEEEQKLEIVICQVGEMQRHCLHGLQLVNCMATQSIENQFAADFIARPRTAEISERELAIKAAAASIYSTCNFLQANENVSCF